MRIIIKTLLAAVIVGIFIAGCEDPKKELVVAQQMADLKRDLEKSERARVDLEKTVVQQEKQIQTLQDMGDKRIEELPYVTNIKLGRYTGAADFDGDNTPDGIKVYLRPIDASGDTIKAAGQAKVQIYDLALPPGENLMLEKKWTNKELAKTFSGGFMTYYYALQCPWKTPPKNPELTVRVEFIEYLTGKHFSAQKVCKVPVKAKATTNPDN